MYLFTREWPLVIFIFIARYGIYWLLSITLIVLYLFLLVWVIYHDEVFLYI